MSKKRRTSSKKTDTQIDGQEHFFGNSNKPAKRDFFSSAQAKLELGSPGDVYEKQADAMASQVVSTAGGSDAVQSKSDFKVQKQGTEEEAQAKLQLQGEEEEMQTKLQRQGEEEEMQTKLQRQEEEEAAQPKLQRKEEGASPGLEFEKNLTASKGGGSPMPKEILDEMEKKFGVSFKGVKIHNDGRAQKLCEEIKAQAFTKGNHIYFNKGKYQPYSAKGKFLLAHELAHVVQQGSTG